MSNDSTHVAIVGMAGRFPGARNVAELWQNLRAGRDAMRRLDEDEASRRGVSPEQWEDPGFVPVVSEMADPDCFDATFFGFNHREAEHLDPQQRVFLECTWEALEDAGLNPEEVAGSAAGVFAGATTNTYLMMNLLPHFRGEKAWDPMSLLISNAVDTLSTRVAYKLDLQGPAFTVQCACSTSLVAVHLAAESLLNEECDLALAGGVSVNVHLRQGYRYEEGSIASPDGRCRAFDAEGRGSIFGSGVGVVVLKRLEDAVADGDPIRAVLLGSAIVNDGARKVGYTAPGVEGQAKVIREALEVSGVEAETVTYIEAHGTATALGDPIEIEALTRAFAEKTQKKQFCAIGSVKTNVGHLDVAAGIAGLIKTVLALEMKEIPPSLHFETPNPRIDFAGSPVYVARELQAWQSPGGPRRAGVSSFGIGGTNAHVILEEAPEREASGPSRDFQLLLFSARRRGALAEMAGRLADHLAGRGDDAADLADVAYTLRTGRASFEHRRMLVCGGRDEAVRILRGEEPEGLLGATPPPGGRTVVFLLPGIGEQYPGMARDLYRREPTFRAAFDRCAEILAPHLERDLREVLYPEGGETAPAAPSGGKLDLRSLLGRSPQAADLGELAQTRFAHPAVFAVEYALARQWESWGVEPEAMIGHSLGEYVAATLSGVISLEEVLPLVAARARRIDELPGGAMLAVVLPEAEVVPRLGDDLWLAAVNSPDVSVVSGGEEAVRGFAERLAEEGIVSTRLPARHAFHSARMEPAVEALVESFGKCRLRAPEVPFISNVTGRFITAGEATDPAYWARHLCRTVRFADGLRELLTGTSGRERVLLEVGPGQGLGAVALQSAQGEEVRVVVVSSLRSRHEPVADQAFLLGALGRLWLAGVEVDWTGFGGDEQRRRVALPSYPFERHRYWIGPGGLGEAAAEAQEPEREEEEAPEGPAGSLHARPELVTPYVAPRGELERQIAEIWQEMLGVESIGALDNFFDLGGHSLLAVQVMSRLRETLHRDLPVTSLYEGRTVRALAELFEGEETAADDDKKLVEELEESRQRRRALQQKRRRQGGLMEKLRLEEESP